MVLTIDAAFDIAIFTAFHPAAVFARTCLAVVFFGTLCFEILLIGVILCVEIFGIRRMWCRYVCPLGAVLALIGLGRILRVRFDGETCTDCISCLSACPFGNDPRKAPLRCRNCGICVSKCPKQVLKLKSY